MLVKVVSIIHIQYVDAEFIPHFFVVWELEDASSDVFLVLFLLLFYFQLLFTLCLS